MNVPIIIVEQYVAPKIYKQMALTIARPNQNVNELSL